MATSSVGDCCRIVATTQVTDEVLHKSFAELIKDNPPAQAVYMEQPEDDSVKVENTIYVEGFTTEITLEQALKFCRSFGCVVNLAMRYDYMVSLQQTKFNVSLIATYQTKEQATHLMEPFIIRECGCSIRCKWMQKYLDEEEARATVQLNLKLSQGL